MKTARAATSGSDDLRFDAGQGRIVSALLDLPGTARAMLVLSHGAGAGMRHPFLAAMAKALAGRGIATLRYQFPFMEAARRRVDSPPVARATVRAAVADARRRAPHLPLFAGGKSFGGRMTSSAGAEEPLEGVRGIVFLGFPLHPPGRPEAAAGRSGHLARLTVPALFLQGTRDAFAELDLIKATVKRLGATARLHLIADADHSFNVPARAGISDAAVRAELANTIAAWIDEFR